MEKHKKLRACMTIVTQKSKVSKKYFVQLFDNKFENLDEMDDFQENKLNLTQKDIKTLITLRAMKTNQKVVEELHLQTKQLMERKLW